MTAAESERRFCEEIRAGIPASPPPMPPVDSNVIEAPAHPVDLSEVERHRALQNALRYFPPAVHDRLAPEFASELARFGRIYMRRYRPAYKMRARPIGEYPARTVQAAAIMHMIQNNLDPRVAQHAYELITYGGNGGVFQNWAQYLLTMRYLSEMTEEQTLVMYSGHPAGLFPSHSDAPRVVVTNGMVVPHYSSDDDYARLAAQGVTMYGQMTAGSYMYIGSQGIVHGTTITIVNSARKHPKIGDGPLAGKLYVSSGLGGMSGAQGKAVQIAGCVGVIAEINRKVAEKREDDKWVSEIHDDLDDLLRRVESAQKKREAVALAYHGNVVDLWQRLVSSDLEVELASDQTSLHSPMTYRGGYYPAGLSLEGSRAMIERDPDGFREKVQESLRLHHSLIHTLCTERGMHFWDYGNAFLLECKRAGCEVRRPDGTPYYKSYVESVMGPLYFDYGFGPFRWVCTSADARDLQVTDRIAIRVIEKLAAEAPAETEQQYMDNLRWIREAEANRLVVGSQARIIYCDEEGRRRIAREFNDAIAAGEISAPVVLGRDHHDVSGADSPFRETSDITDGSQTTADMAVQNVIGDGFRGATWVSIHNGGGVGWGEVINSGFGMVLDGSGDAARRVEMMLHWDVNNGIARRAWARHQGARSAIERAMSRDERLRVTLPHEADDGLVSGALEAAFGE